MTADRQRQEILKHVARDELAALTKDLFDIPGPTGLEREIGDQATLKALIDSHQAR